MTYFPHLAVNTRLWTTHRGQQFMEIYHKDECFACKTAGMKIREDLHHHHQPHPPPPPTFILPL